FFTQILDSEKRHLMTSNRVAPLGNSNSWSIRAQLVLAVNSVLLLIVVGFLTIDHQRVLVGRFADKTTSLQEEAKTLLPGVLHLKSHGKNEIQECVDNECARMSDFDSPGHHFAVELDGLM